MNASPVQPCVAVSRSDPPGGATLAVPGIAEAGITTFLSELESAFAAIQRAEPERPSAAPDPNPGASRQADAPPPADEKLYGKRSTRRSDGSARREETSPSMQERHPLREQEPKAPEAVRSNAKKPSDASGVTVREGGPPALQQAPDPSAASKDKAGEPVSEHRGGLAQKIQATSLSAPGGAGQSGKDQSVLGELNANARTASKAGSIPDRFVCPTSMHKPIRRSRPRIFS